MPATHDVLFVIDPLETFNPRADSTYVMITEALRRGHRPFGASLSGLGLRGHEAVAHVAPVVLATGAADELPRLVYSEPLRRRAMAEFDVVLMRKDPPVDQAYVAATWILDYAGTLVLNAPAGLRTLNEKLSILRFGDLVPKTFISRDGAELREILETLGGRMIVKPVYGFGGREILLARADDPNLGSLLELATAEGTRWTVAQEYLPAAIEGDKRILLVGGEPIGAVLRVPAAGELRNNFHAGGRPALSELSERDRAICSAVGPMLREADQFFVGIDVIGGHLTEINVTSPTGMQEINRLQGLEGERTMQARFWDALEARLRAGSAVH
jgi:glutathione synthase